jgi:hypothetical protein
LKVIKEHTDSNNVVDTKSVAAYFKVPISWASKWGQMLGILKEW